MLLEKVKNTIKKFRLVDRGDKIVVSVSAGPDSTALLFALKELESDLGIKLYIAHLDHMLRTRQEAKKDYEFVSSLSQKLGLPLVADKNDVKRYAKEAGLSLEEAAREKRYKFLLRAAKEVGANKIALGHTLDDQAETVLMRLLRGAGLSGLKGIPPKRSLDGVFIIRPLIEVWRKQIEQYLAALNIRPRQDMTNVKTVFLRNRIRHKLIPYLRRYNPNIKEGLARTAQNLAYDYEVLADIVGGEFKRCARIKAEAVEFKISDLKKMPTGLRRGVLRRAIETLKKNLRRLDYLHIEEIEKLMESPRGALDLPEKIKVSNKKGTIIIHRVRGFKSKALRIRKQLCLPGKTSIPELKVMFDTSFVRRYLKCGKPNNVEYIDYDKTGKSLYVKTWERGDRFRPLGMKQDKKLQDLFVDEKVPRELRNSVPLVVSGKKIILVCGLRLSDGVKITSGTKRILRLSYKHEF